MLSKFGSTFAVLSISVRKLLGVSALKSNGLGLSALNDHEFSVTSILVKRVLSSSYLSRWIPIVLWINVFVDFTPAFQRPPKSIADGGLKCQVILCAMRKPLHFFWCSVDCVNLSNVSNNLDAPTNLVPQSLCICCIEPWHEIKRLKGIRNVSVDKSEASSRYSCLIVMQTKIHMYAWHGTECCWRRYMIGPA